MLSNRAIASNGPSANGLSANGRTAALRLVIPSDGELYEPTLSYLGSCGLSVRRPQRAPIHRHHYLAARRGSAVPAQRRRNHQG